MMNDQEAILFTNEAFYAAFSCGDIAAMSCLWAETDDVSVIHPGWEPLFGREAVLSSWADIVSEGGFPSIICREPHLFLRNDYATVVCFEDIDGIFLAATNVFIKQGDSWRIMHHQAAPTSGRPSKQNELSQSVN
ncbi:MAG: nuclear transport factor 2 family protein [Pseudomonadota bacterium]|nr:nuclear transport factor 2 family protein [Pseudomonadota bacterium]